MATVVVDFAHIRGEGGGGDVVAFAAMAPGVVLAVDTFQGAV
jgi:hypothetical protein